MCAVDSAPGGGGPALPRDRAVRTSRGAYDKYSGHYLKGADSREHLPPESLLPLLDRRQWYRHARQRAPRPGSRFRIVLETRVPGEELCANTTTGLGRTWCAHRVPLTGIYTATSRSKRGRWNSAMAQRSPRVLSQLSPHGALVPRSVSLLPIAKGCRQLRLSRASIWKPLRKVAISTRLPPGLCHKAAPRGARVGGAIRASLQFPPACCSWYAPARTLFRTRSSLITNGLFLAALDESARRAALGGAGAGGTDGAVAVPTPSGTGGKHARRGPGATRTEDVLDSVAAANLPADPRIITVLQKDGVETTRDARGFAWLGRPSRRPELTLKELYVASEESVYPRSRGQHLVPREPGPAFRSWRPACAA